MDHVVAGQDGPKPGDGDLPRPAPIQALPPIGPVAGLIANAEHRNGADLSHRGATRRSDIYAALDLGTNNCRLLVAEPAFRGFRVIDAFSRIVRLGEGLSASRRLSDDAIGRSIEALRVCAAKMKSRGVTRSRLIATEACRAAENGADFVRRVTAETGLALEIVDQRAEALLAASGCAALAAPEAQSVVLFDIGGGSTEMVWLGPRVEQGGLNARIRGWTSLPVGVVTLAERHGGHEVDRATFAAMVDEVRGLMRAFVDVAGEAAHLPGFHLLGTSGTVTTVAGIHLGLERYDRRRVDGIWMHEREIDAVIDDLLDLDYEGRAASPCIGRERADLVLAGCAILEAIRAEFPAQRMRVADRGLREGILMKMMREDQVWRRRRRR